MSTRIQDAVTKNEALEAFERNYGRKRGINPNLPPNLNSELLRTGHLQYENLQGYHEDGLEITEHRIVKDSTLELQRTARIGATLGAVVLNIGAAIGLLYSGGRLILSSLFGAGDLEDAYSSTSKSFTAGSIAGLANAASHENVNWGGGALGMGLFSRYLDKPWGLAAFSIFDGLNAMGMGEVKRRDGKNATPMPRSIFNRVPQLYFLKPYEQAIRSFWTRFTSKQGWKKTLTDEPYELFQSAGGGLISGGAALGIASLFSSKMSEKVKSLCYLPYSITSLVNLIALGRDGVVTKGRASLIDGREPMETRMLHVEGWGKAIAAPILALNYGLLGLKGIGIDFRGVSEHLAMGLRTWGVATAYIGFAAQSAVKFFIPDLFGPRAKEIIKVILRPKSIMEKFIEIIKGVERERPKICNPNRQSDFFEPIINSDRNHELLNRISSTKIFQRLKLKSQTGLPNEMARERSFLDRYVHSRRVCAIGILFYNSLLRNTAEPALKEYLQDEDLETAFKIACLTHDNGQFMRSHLMETAICGLDNDEESIKGLRKGSEIYDEILNYYTEIYGPEEGERKADKILKTAQQIIGFKHQLSYKWNDFMEYLRSSGGDANSSFGFEPWGRNEYEYFCNQIRLYKKQDGSIGTGFTEEGAVLAFKALYYRLIFNAYLNYHPITQAKEFAYKLGIQNANLSLNDVLAMESEKTLDRKALEGVENISGTSSFVIRNLFGGRKAYCGYGQPKDRIIVVTEDANGNIQTEEFLQYLEKVIKHKNPDLYNSLQPMVRALTTPVQIEIKGEIIPSLSDESAESNPFVVSQGIKGKILAAKTT